MKQVMGLIVLAAGLALIAPALAVEFEFHGDLNHRFLIYTDRHDWLNPEQKGVVNKNSVDSTYGELKYRFWFEAADDNGNIKAVYGIEIGGVRFGEEGTGRGQGGSYSGDGANVETRWAYLDFQTPGVDEKSRWKMGLFTWNVNPYLWSETASGINLNGSLGSHFGYEAGWIRTVDTLARDDQSEFENVDNFLLRFNLKPLDRMKLGLFGLWVLGDDDRGAADAASVTTRDWLLKQFATNAYLNYINLGLDGSYSPGNLFFNWDLIYQTGKIKDIILDDTEFSGLSGTDSDYDLNAWFAHFDAGYKLAKHTFTYTFWYASGDDDPQDDDFKGFLAIDLDRDDSLTMFEGLYTDDDSYFTERPYLLDKGFIMNKLAWDYKWTEKLTVGAAAMYMMTAEDIEYTDGNGNRQRNSDIGVEVNGYMKYMLFKNVELAVNAGYLFSGDAMDAFETERDGNADENIFGTSARVRYKF